MHSRGFLNTKKFAKLLNYPFDGKLQCDVQKVHVNLTAFAQRQVILLFFHHSTFTQTFKRNHLRLEVCANKKKNNPQWILPVCQHKTQYVVTQNTTIENLMALNFSLTVFNFNLSNHADLSGTAG